MPFFTKRLTKDVAILRPIPIGPSQGATVSITSDALENTCPNLSNLSDYSLRNVAAFLANLAPFSIPSAIFPWTSVAVSIFPRISSEIGKSST